MTSLVYNPKRSGVNTGVLSPSQSALHENLSQKQNLTTKTGMEIKSKDKTKRKGMSIVSAIQQAALRHYFMSVSKLASLSIKTTA